MASLRKCRGKWYVRIFYSGKEKLVPTHTKLRRDAEITLRKYQENETAVKLQLATSLMETENTIKKCMKYFKANYQRETGIEDSTLKNYEVAINKFHDCFGGETSINTLKKTDYSKLVAHLKANRYNDITINIRLRSIRAFLNYLHEKDMIKTLPFKVKQIKTDKAPPKMITPDELDEIYKQIKDPYLLASYKVLEVTGMRVGELKNSRREGEFVVVEKSKSRRKRYIPIPVEYIQDYDTAKEAGYSDSWLSHSFSTASKDAGFTGKTCHSLRHTFAYRMLLETDNIQLVRDILGHSSISVTEKYTQIPMDYLKQVFADKNINTQNNLKTVGKA